MDTRSYRSPFEREYCVVHTHHFFVLQSLLPEPMQCEIRVTRRVADVRAHLKKFFFGVAACCVVVTQNLNHFPCGTKTMQPMRTILVDRKAGKTHSGFQDCIQSSSSQRPAFDTGRPQRGVQDSR